MQLSTKQYNMIERAIAERQRLVLFRRGTEYIVLPDKLALRTGREVIETMQPSTGDRMTIYLDELDAFEVVGD